MIGTDSGGTYFFREIIDYDFCCTCKYFSDNFFEERFECTKEDSSYQDCNKDYFEK